MRALIKVTMSCTTSTTALQILVGDDQADVLEALRLLLKGAGHKTVTVDSPAALHRASQAGTFDLILMDLNYARDTTSGQEGLDLLKRFQAENNTVPVVVMTAWGNIELAVEAMRRGASDFVQKPWDNARLLETIHRQSRRREQSEMELARHVQRNLFPKESPTFKTLECYGKCVPAREVSGDYYDYLPLSRSRTAFILADVSGKGMGSALLMANLQASFRSQSALAERNPVDLLESVNRLFFESTPPEHYATLFYGEYDDNARQFRYVNCGHLSGILVRADQVIERLEPSATVLGLFPSWTGELKRIDLNPRDTLTLFSDGVTEAGIDAGEEYGEERLISMLRSLSREKPARIVDRVISSVQGFSAEHQGDDITLMVLQRANTYNGG